MYDPAAGVTFDGLEADGRINPNSGAESTIHGLLTMLALDAHPAVRARATALTTEVSRDGLRVVEAEAATSTTGSVVTPGSAWTGESSWSGGKYLALEPGETATLGLGDSTAPVSLAPVTWQEEDGTARSRWTQGDVRLGTLRHRVGDQGITAAPGALLPQGLDKTVRPADGAVSVVAQRDDVELDAVLVRPLLSSAVLRGTGTTTTLLQSASSKGQTTQVVPTGGSASVRVYDGRGRLKESRTISGATAVRLPAHGIAVVVGRAGVR
jgi:hypothetical protein